MPLSFDNTEIAFKYRNDKELKRVVSVIKEHRTLMGRELNEFETRVAKLFGKKYGIMTNSGSSANLIAVELLDLEPGSEIITPVLSFSTVVAPVLKRGLVPVFVDVKQGTYVIDEDKVEAAISKKTKALLIPIMFGNVPNMEKLAKIAKKYKLFFIDDSCDALVSYYKDKPTGAYTDISTCSFYGSHVITAGGGGGIVVVNSDKFRDNAKMLRGWGRSSSVFSESESIEKRFKYKIGN